MTKDAASHKYEFYGAQYARFSSDLAIAMRREIYGEDLGQQGWRSLEEQAELAAVIAQFKDCHVLDIACGSGGPSLALVAKTGCHVTGIDIEASGIEEAQRLAHMQGLSDRARFSTLDCSKRLPFEDRSFDVVICIDAVVHLADRFAVLADWARVARPGGRVVFTDAAVLAGLVSVDDLAIRASQGSFQLAPPGLNETAIAAAGLRLLRSEDRTDAMAEIAGKTFAVRERHTAELQQSEGAEWFAKRQLFLQKTAELASGGQLARYLYIAERPDTTFGSP